ncbi:unnamed protein product [Ostreobium quekettii]|uniref:Uncharacterized protein n=1 Tax=Ostreobium quekettii TaxID=121088 RepID=A0A8S1JEM0_9CHLO|nr:unnamed protein product [Ostreobium quekettii]CAD7702234.1 unnamed protein product [Ostreobium quekettii]
MPIRCREDGQKQLLKTNDEAPNPQVPQWMALIDFWDTWNTGEWANLYPECTEQSLRNELNDVWHKVRRCFWGFELPLSWVSQWAVDGQMQMDWTNSHGESVSHGVMTLHHSLRQPSTVTHGQNERKNSVRSSPIPGVFRRDDQFLHPPSSSASPTHSAGARKLASAIPASECRQSVRPNQQARLPFSLSRTGISTP